VLELLGGVGSLFSTLWEWKGVILLGLVVVGFLMAYGFLKPFVDAILGTYNRVILPLLEKVIASPYGLAVVAGVAFVLWTGGWWYFSDRSGYRRAQGECNVEIATRERDALREELKTTRERLAVLESIRLKDATQALGQAELERENQKVLDAIPNDTRPCFDESIARSLWPRR